MVDDESIHTVAKRMLSTMDGNDDDHVTCKEFIHYTLWANGWIDKGAL